MASTSIDLIRKKKQICTCSRLFCLSLPLFCTTTMPFCTTKGNVTQDDSQRRFLAQHRVAMLEQCRNYTKQCRNNVTTLCCAKNRRCESSRVTSPYNVTRPSYTLLLWRNCRMCLPKILFPVFMFAVIFSPPLIFTWPLTFLIFSPPLWNFHVFLPTKFVSSLLL